MPLLIDVAEVFNIFIYFVDFLCHLIHGTRGCFGWNQELNAAVHCSETLGAAS